MEPARIVELPAMRVVRRLYRGPRPPAPPFFAHWRALHAWAREHGVKSDDPDIVMLGFESPAGWKRGAFAYEACIPSDYAPADGEDVESAEFPGGTFLLVRGELTELPNLYREARIHAGHHGVAFERGGLEIYRPHPRDPRSYLVDAGVGVHHITS